MVIYIALNNFILSKTKYLSHPTSDNNNHRSVYRIFIALLLGIFESFFIPGTASAMTSGISVNEQGIASVEAEHYESKLARGGREWVPDAQRGYSGESAMRTTGRGAVATDYATNSPQLDYAIEFTTPGTYYLWLRAFGPSNGKNSVHIGLDGQAIGSGENIYVAVTGGYVWTNGLKVRMEVPTPGRHTLNLWMREAGTIVDKIVISTDPAYTPQGLGPPSDTSSNDNVDPNGVAVASAGGGIQAAPAGQPAPTAPSANGGGDALLTLSWDAHPQPVNGFIVYYGDSPETATTELSVLDFSNGDIDRQAPKVEYWMASDLGLATDTQVCFRVKAYDATDVSDFSEVICTL